MLFTPVKSYAQDTVRMQLVGESLDFREHPIASLVISFNWSEENLDKAHDIFEKYDTQLENGEKPNWVAFEGDFKDQLGLGYQSVKVVVLAFYRNYQWTNVCEIYAKAHECVEFHEITRSKASNK